VNHDYEIPPHARNAPAHNQPQQQQHNQEATSSPSTPNNLIDFGDPSSSSPSHQQQHQDQQHQQQKQRNRSISLMDDDRPINYDTTEKKVHGGHMDLMGDSMHASVTSTSSATGMGTGKVQGQGQRQGQPLERTDTQTSEVDSFFDAEG
jgi:hypothetical protein